MMDMRSYEDWQIHSAEESSVEDVTWSKNDLLTLNWEATYMTDEIPEDTALAADMVFPCKVFRAQYQLRFGVDVSSNVSAGDYVFQETTLAKAIVSFVTNNGKDV